MGVTLGSTSWNLSCPLLVDAGEIRIVSYAKSCHSESHRSAWTLPLGSAWPHSRRLVLATYAQHRVYKSHTRTRILGYSLCYPSICPFPFQDMTYCFQTEGNEVFLLFVEPNVLYPCRSTMFTRDWTGRIRTNPFLRVAGNVHCLLNRHRLKGALRHKEMVDMASSFSARARLIW